MNELTTKQRKILKYAKRNFDVYSFRQLCKLRITLKKELIMLINTGVSDCELGHIAMKYSTVDKLYQTYISEMEKNDGRKTI